MIPDPKETPVTARIWALRDGIIEQRIRRDKEKLNLEVMRKLGATYSEAEARTHYESDPGVMIAAVICYLELKEAQ